MEPSMRILNAIAEYIEARAELVRETAATTGLRTYSRAYKDGQEDLMSCDCGCMEGADESPDCG
jgi:hypothetical protein